MAGANSKRILQLIKAPGNDICADCNSDEVDYASYNIGVFLCTLCAGVHSGLGAHISNVKHLKLGSWEDSQVKQMGDVGNIVAQRVFEKLVPVYYRRPSKSTPQILRDQWIRAKYERKEFIHSSKQGYVGSCKEGYLLKRSKINDSLKPRRFVLSEQDGMLKYFVGKKKEPKTEIRILEMNVSLAPEKCKSPASFQINYLNQGSTRHIYIYHNDPHVLIEWYMAIRSAKLNLLHVSYPTMADADLLKFLTQDFLKEGYLFKMGPKSSDAFRKRWFTLEGRKFMYHEKPMDAYPKGEIFLRTHKDGFSVCEGASPTGDAKGREQGFSFYLKTPTRCFWLYAEREDDREEWINLLNVVMKQPLTPQDYYCKSNLKLIEILVFVKVEPLLLYNQLIMFHYYLTI